MAFRPADTELLVCLLPGLPPPCSVHHVGDWCPRCQAPPASTISWPVRSAAASPAVTMAATTVLTSSSTPHCPSWPVSPLRTGDGSQTPCSESGGFPHTWNKNQATAWPVRPRTSLPSPILPLASGLSACPDLRLHTGHSTWLCSEFAFSGVVSDSLPRPPLSWSITIPAFSHPHPPPASLR